MGRERIAIVGAGPAGLTAALALQRVGFDVTVFEKGHDLHRFGGGCVIQSSGLRALDALGLLELVAPIMRYTRRMAIERPVGVWQSSFDYGSVPIPQNRAACVARTELLDYLLSAVEWAQIPVFFGRRCTRVESMPEHCSVGFAHGPPFECEMVIAADGVHSAVSEAAELAATATTSGLAYVHGLVERYTADATVRELRTIDGRSCTVYPLLNGRTAFACGVPVAGWRGILRSGLRQWIDGWAAQSAEVGELLHCVEDWKAVGYSEAHSVVRAHWWSGRVFAIGDAAHAMTPFLGQGISAGMVDALVLAQLLVESEDLDLIGERYQALREPVTSRMQRESARADLGWRPRPLLARLLDGGRAVPAVDWSDAQLGYLAAGYNAAEDRFFQTFPGLGGARSVGDA